MVTTKIKTESGLIKEAIEKVKENNHLPPEGTSIAVGMSGGVDSSVTTALMHAIGYQVVGVTGWLSDNVNASCDGARGAAQDAAEQIGIEHQVVDLREVFKPTIISPFINSYAQGRTPVPCMTCNTEIKWGSLLEYSKELGATHFASGHYVRLIKHAESAEFSEGYTIGRPTDPSKDQSYMLWTLSQEKMSRAAFPLANFTKDYTRAVAQELGLWNADRPESMDICFVPGKPKEYLKEKLGERVGEIKHIKDNRVMAEHSGTHLYTIGQRKGIGIAHPTPLYVVKLDALNNVVYVGDHDDLFAPGLEAASVNWQRTPKSDQFRSLAKIRYASAPTESLIQCPEKTSFKMIFDEEQASVTPGQAAVIYDPTDSYIIGGGWIEKALIAD